MSFLVYFFVLLVSAASVLFGLDLINSPLPNTHNVPIGRSVQVLSQPSPQGQRNKEGDVGKLMPVRPVVPAVSKQAQISGNASHQDAWLPPPETNQATVVQHIDNDNKTTGEPMTSTRGERLAPTKSTAPAETSSMKSIAQTPVREAATPKQAKVEPSSQPTAAVGAKSEQAMTTQPRQSAAQQGLRSRLSFVPRLRLQLPGLRRPAPRLHHEGNATNASVQPRALGPRQTKNQASDTDELDGVERIVRRQPLQLEQLRRPARNSREMSEAERIVRRMTPDDETDIPVQGPGGKIIIVRKSYP